MVDLWQICTTIANWDITTILFNMAPTAIALDWTTTSSVVTAHTDMEVWVTITQDSLGTTTYTRDTDHIYHTDRAIWTKTSSAIKAWACPLPPFHKFCPHSDQDLYFKRRIHNGQQGTGESLIFVVTNFCGILILQRLLERKLCII